MSKLYNLTWDRPAHVDGDFSIIANVLGRDKRVTGNATKVYLILAGLAPLKMYITQDLIGAIAVLSKNGVSAAFRCLYRTDWLEKDTQKYNGRVYTKYLLHYISATAKAKQVDTDTALEQEQESEPPQWQESIGGGFDSLHQGQQEETQSQTYSLTQALFMARGAGVEGEALLNFQRYLETLQKNGVGIDKAKINILIHEFLASRDFHSGGIMRK